MPLDPDQLRIVDRLDHLRADLVDSEASPRGLYVHGAIGRGKTWLCDQFFEQLPGTAKRRVHFHGFFRELHRDVWSHRLADPTAAGHAVDRAIAQLLDGVDLLFFDEFHVHDSGDAALVLRVLDDVLASDVTLLATSNYAPADLLPGPFHHVFERGIRLLEQNLDVVELGGEDDYRRDGNGDKTSGFARGTWLTPGTPHQLLANGLTPPTPTELVQLSAGGHRFTAQRADARQLWFSFTELCERNTSVADYLAWAVDHEEWVVEGVPRLSEATPQAAKRFANLIDVLCDRGATLHLVSQHPPDEIFEGRQLPIDSARTASRLALLQTVIHTQP